VEKSSKRYKQEISRAYINEKNGLSVITNPFGVGNDQHTFNNYEGHANSNTSSEGYGYNHQMNTDESCGRTSNNVGNRVLVEGQLSIRSPIEIQSQQQREVPIIKPTNEINMRRVYNNQDAMYEQNHGSNPFGNQNDTGAIETMVAMDQYRGSEEDVESDDYEDEESTDAMKQNVYFHYGYFGRFTCFKCLKSKPKIHCCCFKCKCNPWHYIFMMILFILVSLLGFLFIRVLVYFITGTMVYKIGNVELRHLFCPGDLVVGFIIGMVYFITYTITKHLFKKWVMDLLLAASVGNSAVTNKKPSLDSVENSSNRRSHYVYSSSTDNEGEDSSILTS